MPKYFVVAHGDFSASDETFVPQGVTLYFYTARDTSANQALSLAKLGMVTFEQKCAQSSRVDLYPETKSLPNYTLDAVSPHEAALAFSMIEDSAAAWLYCMDRTSSFCTKDKAFQNGRLVSVCHNGIHRCQGLLSKVKRGTEVHIVCCRQEESEPAWTGYSEQDKEILQPYATEQLELSALIKDDTEKGQRYTGKAAQLWMDKHQTNAGILSLSSKIRQWYEEFSAWNVPPESRNAYILNQDPETLNILMGSPEVLQWLEEETFTQAEARLEYYKKGTTGLAEYVETLNDEEREYVMRDEFLVKQMGILTVYQDEPHPTDEGSSGEEQEEQQG